MVDTINEYEFAYRVKMKSKSRDQIFAERMDCLRKRSNVLAPKGPSQRKAPEHSDHRYSIETAGDEMICSVHV